MLLNCIVRKFKVSQNKWTKISHSLIYACNLEVILIFKITLKMLGQY